MINKLPKLKLTGESMNKEQFFGKLFQLRNQIHLFHLSVKGAGAYAAHVATNGFYDELLDLTDAFIESYQGKYGIVSISIPAAKSEEAIPTIKAFARLVDGGVVYKMFEADTWLQNQLDEMSALAYQTLYKLENLK